MTLQLIFWVLLLLYIVLGAINAPRNWPGIGGALIPVLLWLTIGWAVFGQPIQG